MFMILALDLFEKNVIPIVSIQPLMITEAIILKLTGARDSGAISYCTNGAAFLK
ncbi:hypothetical protein [Bacillus sp. V5-8f]|uniref:hypothetical protein n=1 Tax=Bacillus sp. V5-8f TaxID=2053044 RepID=UPI0015E0A09E|nr:hypothetical protein [Bacillus sp. V5-8f]